LFVSGDSFLTEMHKTTYGIAASLTISVLFLFAACDDRLSEAGENQENPGTIRESIVKRAINTGLSENQSDTQHGSFDETINIGLIVSSQVSKNELARAASDGAELAIKQANNAGGYDHKDFRLMVRSCDGPWGVAAKQAVSLITDYGVKALLTSLDGRNAHLIEQVATKAKVMMLSTRATDPTLSQAFVPWYFRCVPDDNLQAEALANELVKYRRHSNFIVVSENSNDSRLASGSFIKRLKKIEAGVPEQFIYDQLKPDFNELMKQIRKTGISYIVLFGGPENSLRFIKVLSESARKYVIYGPCSIMGEKNTLKEFWNFADNMVLTSPDLWFTPKGKKFQEVFQETYGYLPGPAAAYAYDGMNMLVEAIQKGGLEQEKIVNFMAGIKYEGVTGTIQFDDKGNRKNRTGIMEITDGIPFSVGAGI
jgi:branched-chain amino acid transport system substrate-binding protein